MLLFEVSVFSVAFSSFGGGTFGFGFEKDVFFFLFIEFGFLQELENFSAIRDYLDELEEILYEQDEKKPAKEPSDQVKQDLAQSYLDRTGLSQKYDDQWQEIVDNKQEEIDAILKERKVIVISLF